MDWPDIEPWRQGNAGVPFVHVMDSGRPGPHVLIGALTHGNEPCGAIALTRLLEEGIRPARGRLTLMLANHEAYAAFLRGRRPARFLDRDLNRLWRDEWIDGDRKSIEAARARELRPFIADADIFLDLHSTAFIARPFFVLADLAKARRLADRIGIPPVQQIMPGGCAEGRHTIDYGRFSDPAHPAAAVTLECGRHDDPKSGDVALAAARRLLALEGLAGDPPPPTDHAIERYRTGPPCIVRSDDFAMTLPEGDFHAIRKGGIVAMDGGVPVRAPFDATIVSPRPRPKAGEIAFFWCERLDPA